MIPCPWIRIDRYLEMRQFLFWLEVGLLIAAAGTLGYSGYRWAAARAFQRLAARDLRAASRLAPLTNPSMEGSVLGKIEIPRLGVSTVILEGTVDSTLDLGVGHIPGTALPAQAGNVGLAGHRDTFFRPLRQIAPGDSVLIATGDRAYWYVVEETRVVTPEDVYVLEPTAQDALTLVTCYPFSFIGAAPKRFVVRAIRTETNLRSEN